MGTRARVLGIVAMIAAAGAAASMAACDSEGNAVKEPAPGVDSGSGPTPGGEGGPPLTTDGGPLPDGAPGDCVQNPKTHAEIINGCTDAVKITKKPTLPLLSPDGGLPPLP
jgi:hypothetical protein